MDGVEWRQQHQQKHVVDDCLNDEYMFISAQLSEEERGTAQHWCHIETLNNRTKLRDIRDCMCTNYDTNLIYAVRV